MRFWNAIDRIEGGMASIGAGVCLLAMIVITVISVIGRYVLEQDILPGAYNLIERICFPLIVFWGAPMAHREGLFPRFDMVVAALPVGLRRYVLVGVLLVEVAIYAVLMWYLLGFTWRSIEGGRTMQIGTDVWPVWPILVMMPLAFALMMLEMGRLIWRDAHRIDTGAQQRETDNVSAAS